MPTAADSTVILHLTDLHFGWEGGPNEQTLSAQRTNCLNALHEALAKLTTDNTDGNWKPDIVAITGDLGWKGAAGDYKQLGEWLSPVLQSLGLTYSDVVTCPGNHDVNRELAAPLGRFIDAAAADHLLGVEVPRFYSEIFTCYSAFCKHAGIPEYQLGKTTSYLVGTRTLHGVRFVALNSAWCCRGEDDISQLWVGKNHLERLQADGLLREAVDAELSVVAIVHHPPDWWHDSDKNTRNNRLCVNDMLAERSHVILTGHEHSPGHRADQLKERAWLMRGGASYAGGNYSNVVRLIRLNRDYAQYRLLEYNPGLPSDPWQLKSPSGDLSLSSKRATAAISGRGTAHSPTTATITAYRKHLTEHTNHLELLGIGRSLNIKLPIAEAYIPLLTKLSDQIIAANHDCLNQKKHAVETPVAIDEQSVTPKNDSVDALPFEQIFHICGKLNLRGVVVLGEPGAGKTTVARQLAWQLASGNKLPADFGLPSGILPVLLRLRNLKPESINAIDSPVDALKQFLRSEVRCPGEAGELQDPCDDLWKHPQGLLWIIDGLDEVVDVNLRAIVSSWIQKTLPERLHDRFLITCRFQGYRTADVALGGKFVEFHVQGLSDGQVHCFVHAWFTAASRRLHVLSPDKAPVVAADDSASLLQILNTLPYQSRGMRELVTNPLMLTILCVLYHQERSLPTARAELYQHCVRVLLGLWRKDFYNGRTAQGVLQPFDSEAAQSVLARLAWRLHQNAQCTTGERNELAAEATQGLQLVTKESGLGLDGEQFVQRMREESGILAYSGTGTGQLGFMHLSFQEFLAADHAVRESLSAHLAERVQYSWWQEVALLSLRRSKAYCAQFFEDMLANGLAEQHADLAQRCLTESLYFVPAPFLQVLKSSESTVQRKSAVLRLLLGRQQQVPELGDLCEQFLASKDPALKELRGIATELLATLGRLPKKSGGPEPFAVSVDGRTGVTFVWIPPGEFQMGAENGSDDEMPVHSVTLTRFLVGTLRSNKRGIPPVSGGGTRTSAAPTIVGRPKVQPATSAGCGSRLASGGSLLQLG